MVDEVKTIESQLKLVRLAADDWQKRLRPARKALDDAERKHLELQQQRRKLRAELAAITDDVTDMAYLQLKARAERLEAQIVRAAEDAAKARKTLANLEVEWHGDISRQRSDVVMAWRKFAHESEDALRAELLALG